MARKRVALITGITGQDGSYLAEFLLSKGYDVYGIVRKTSHFLYANIAHIQHRLNIIQADLLDPVSLASALTLIKGLGEVYNLASQSSPAESFRQPVHTAEITGIGAQRVMETVRDIHPKARFYQASSSEMFGWVKEIPQNEDTPFNPANPYAAAKLYAHNIARIYRKSYGMHISCGILFNHESPRRGLGFVTQKVTYAVACAKLGIKNSEHLNEEGDLIMKNGKVALGNLDAKRDWGFAGDYVKSMWLMLQQRIPDDYVIGTGETHTIKDLCKKAFSYVGLDWKNYIEVDKRFIRPTETGPLVADYSKAKRSLGWQPKTKFSDLVAMLVDANIARLK
ncbi:GDP-mannose 4,6-dehydratase [Candidatus Woesebacteria bacterium RIFCSPHIGHO2_01_FULL_38_10]|uniref:GDP-mannose 4,6-dehydratase n=1 Tax=Candidatus Woesebacteria bacterium RIFCSPLOWO2_01_FULL_39_10b TaxID=1802517 RepID=A0A1F8B980_9BACT|nr:MAG: GDP-mannose 4,6-dehydratase [Candidatus Woesebacteria bacterium RIFCSPHIGHO2_01_FULL_38_10]OGM60606.1 MAG: GDP-mannose 4,6-dehydratase [Candidatus Woesebacteria bacterium RIFCSPLOWO2_01_FULL_39_10b]